jgi:ATP-dependent protease HslVU (ClpYQ) peptidase subunit
MTTIAYRDGILASDTQVTHGPTIMKSKCRKVFKLPDGSLYGHTGSLEAGELMRRSLVSGEAPPNLTSDAFDGIMIRPNGQTFFYENKAWVKLKVDFCALGSGKEHAYGAMAVGASAEQAVHAAITLDPVSGGRVQYVELEDYTKKHSYVEQLWDK